MEGEVVAAETPRFPPSRGLGAAALLAVLVAGVDKALLFRNLEYPGSDLYSFLEMSWSWFYAGLFLHDNAYGFHGAIHNFYLLPAFAPLTIPLGAYGLILVLVLAHGAAVVRLARCARLDPVARLVVLVGSLGPLAFYVFDNPHWGFHPELLYPPLALLLALELLAGWSWRSVALCAVVVLVKEDGALVCAAVVTAHTVWRVRSARAVSKAEARRAGRAGLLALLVLAVVFVAGLALLSYMSQHHAGTQQTSDGRLAPAVRAVVRTLGGYGRIRLHRVLEASGMYLLMSLSMLLPLGRRLPRGLLLLACAGPPLVATLLVSSAAYRFNMMLWPPRVATLQAGVVAALVFASLAPPGRRPARLAVVALLAAVSWAGQLGVLHRMGYPIADRLAALGSAFGPPRSPLGRAEDRYLRCAASHLPGGLPVSAGWTTHPLFHRQSIVLATLEEHAWHPPRVRVAWAAESAEPTDPAECRGPRVGVFVLEGECDLLARVAVCDPSP
jgi:hypothetical protein